MQNYYHHAKFLCAAHTLKQTPEDAGLEVAFAGRSNAGKSSAINAISEQNALARTSKTPGRTQQIVFFTLDEQRRLVDLPGYGYAKVPLSVKQHWQKTLERYLQERHSLQGLIMLMDIRHPFTDYDAHMTQWCLAGRLPLHILLTKADKLSRGKAHSTLQQVRNQCVQFAARHADPSPVTAQLFSALKKDGVQEARQCLDVWLQHAAIRHV